MTIDMKKIRPGCILPCKDRVVESVIHTDDFVYHIKFVGDSFTYVFDEDGFHPSMRTLDITTIIEPPFDWDAVKPGDKFWYKEQRVFYVRKSNYTPCVIVENDARPFACFKSSLTPINDKEI